MFADKGEGSKEAEELAAVAVAIFLSSAAFRIGIAGAALNPKVPGDTPSCPPFAVVGGFKRGLESSSKWSHSAIIEDRMKSSITGYIYTFSRYTIHSQDYPLRYLIA
jgi:hypothetical protein